MPVFSASTAIFTAARMRRVRLHLKQGGVIAYPTESCYGLGCDPRNRAAVMRLLKIKGRPQGKGLILIGSDFAQLKSYASPLSQAEWQKISNSWPGPVTWLLPASHMAPPWLRGRHSSIAVRVTAHPQAAFLCQNIGMALVSTSANRAGLKPIRNYSECVNAFGSDVLVLPGMIGKRRRPSTILDLETDKVIR